MNLLYIVHVPISNGLSVHCVLNICKTNDVRCSDIYRWRGSWRSAISRKLEGPTDLFTLNSTTEESVKQIQFFGDLTIRQSPCGAAQKAPQQRLERPPRGGVKVSLQVVDDPIWQIHCAASWTRPWNVANGCFFG